MAEPAKPKPVTPQEAAHAVKQVAKEAVKVSESAAHLEASAGAVERSADLQTETAVRRTILAADRTVLAAERTYAAWLRTGLAALASGVGAHALFGDTLPRWLVVLVGSIMVIFAGFCFAAGAWRQAKHSRFDPAPDLPALPGFLAIGFSILLGIACIASLAVILLAP